MTAGSARRPNRYLFYFFLGRGPVEIDVQQAVFKRGPFHLHAVGQDEAAHEAARGDAAVQKRPIALAAVTPANHIELAVLDRHLELGGGETGHRQGDPDRAFAELLDVVGRIALGRRLRGPLDQHAGVIEAEKKRTIEQRRTVHRRALARSDSARRRPSDERPRRSWNLSGDWQPGLQAPASLPALSPATLPNTAPAIRPV